MTCSNYAFRDIHTDDVYYPKPSKGIIIAAVSRPFALEPLLLTSMTPEESSELSLLGQILYSNLFGGNIFTCLLFGLYILAFSISLYPSAKTGIRARPRKVLWACIIVLLLCNVWSFANQIIALIVDIKTTFMISDSLETVLDTFIARDSKVSIVDNLNLVVGDAIVAWRAWAIWSESRIAKFLLAILMMGNIGTNIADILLDSIDTDSSAAIPMDEISSIFSLAVNLLSTMLIAFKVWRHRQTLKMVSVKKTKHTQVEKILLFLVESGVVYCAIQCLYVIIQIFATKLGNPVGLETWNIGIGQVAEGTAFGSIASRSVSVDYSRDTYWIRSE
ncbi:hypothetical protein BT96DRAFT_991183 [Gymnopus androsaceus JB14]|uniref:Uncharacterized protein n=1 Tax=Gymnopus androsaceus JB14 TaxID=1447944 RepID=A0A6A4HYU8_9AGAR|nr:hypothetical protein BT96DRAFT_991183 [Gymnopus androsaceus JB14]